MVWYPAYMAKKEIITIAGAIGAGKSSTAKAVAQHLGYRHFSSGDLFRQIALERGISIEAMNLTAEEQQDIDREVDRNLIEIGETEEQFVVESRLAFHWIPDSFKVFLALDTETAAERIFAHIKNEGRVSQEATSVEEVLKNTLGRAASERKRYMNLYQIDVSDLSPFDLVIDTKTADLEHVVETLLSGYEKWRSL